MKDIFIDTNIAKNFSNPMDQEYIKLIEWLQNYDEVAVNEESIEKGEFAHLVVSKKLLVEYYSSARNASSNTSIPIIIDQLTRQGRLNSLSNQQIKHFKAIHFNKAIEKKFQSNEKDQNHIPIILMSNRKMALTLDQNFKKDLENFSGYTVKVEKRPQDLNYQ